MTNLEFLKIECYFGIHFEQILSFIRAPQFKDLETVRLSLPSMIQAVATDSSGHSTQFKSSNSVGRSPIMSRTPSR